MTRRAASLPTAPHRDQRRGEVGLLIVDMINCFDFPDAEKLRAGALSAAQAIASLRSSLQRFGAPTIYVNDNFGEWHSEKSLLVDRALESASGVTERLMPDDADFFVIKPQFSGFYATNLPVLLPKLGVSRLIITGVATDICVLFTAADAHMRDYSIWVPSDAVAAADDRGAWALEIMRSSMGAETAPTTDLSVASWTRQLNEQGAR